MKQITARFIAVLLLVIPGVIACFGFLNMKNALFHYFSAFGDDSITPSFEWWLFISGFIMFFIGVGFIGGWIFFRDRKRNYVATRFKKKRPRPPKPRSTGNPPSSQ